MLWTQEMLDSQKELIDHLLKKQPMNREEFLALTLDQVSQVYNGKRNCCRCGCGGNYIASSYMQNPRSEVNDSLVALRLKRAQALVRNGAKVDYGDTYVDVRTGKNRTLTVYVFK